MRRDGHVYPYVKSAAIGYGYGHEQHDDHAPDGPCRSQIAPECTGDHWDHLETHNEYGKGGLSRKVEYHGISMARNFQTSPQRHCHHSSPIQNIVRTGRKSRTK